MSEEKSFLPRFRPMNLNINDAYSKSRSLSSKSFYQGDKFSFDKKYGINYDQNGGIHRIHQKTFRSHQNQNLRPQSQMHENLFQQKKISAMNSINRQQKLNLFRSKSVHEVHQHHRIQMLYKINNFLDNHLTKRRNEEAQRQAKQRNEFQIQIIAKLDKLEKYLCRIKSQREKQQKPRQVIQNQQVTKNVHKQVQMTQQIPLNFNTPPSNQYQRVLSELDKIQSELSKTRAHAIQVKERNSLSKKKKQNPEIQELENCQIKTIRPKIVRQGKQSQKYLIEKPAFLVNQKFRQVRTNNHIHQNQFPLNISQTLNQNYRPQVTHMQKSLSKPKVTFSFANKV